MAHTKEGLTYFSLDVDMDNDDKIRLIEKKHGMVGFAVVVKLLMKIYKNGYYYSWTNDEQNLFADCTGVNRDELDAIIQDTLCYRMFSECLHDKYNILTSRGIQKRYVEGVTRRVDVKMISEYLLIDKSMLGKVQTVNIMNTDVDIMNTDVNPLQHSAEIPKHNVYKVKESKLEEKESRVEETTTAANLSDLSPDELNCRNNYEFTIYPFYQIAKKYNPKFPLVLGNMPPVVITNCLECIKLLQTECKKQGIDWIEHLLFKLNSHSWSTKLSNAGNQGCMVIGNAAHWAVKDLQEKQGKEQAIKAEADKPVPSPYPDLIHDNKPASPEKHAAWLKKIEELKNA